MDWKKTIRRLFFPPPVITALLCIIALVMLVHSFIALEETSALSIAAYVLSFTALTLVCLRIPDMIRFIQDFRTGNRYYLLYKSDVQLRMNISLWGSFAFNAAYAVFNLALGLWHHSAYFYAMTGYYLLLGGLRLMLARSILGHAPGDDKAAQWRRYRLCGVWLLLMTLTLTVFVLYFVYRIRPFNHHEITTIAMAAYTFAALTLAIVNAVRYLKYDSPAYSAAKALSLVSAVVSLLTLENAMFTAFGQDTDETLRQIMLRITGSAIIIFVMALAIRMILRSSRALRRLSTANNAERGQHHG